MPLLDNRWLSVMDGSWSKLVPKSTVKIKSPTTHDVACCFQGGGSIGAYQTGILNALQEAGYAPTWFIGTSIGAINSAISAGNAIEDRFDKLQEFWTSIATPQLVDNSMLPNDLFSRRMQHFVSSQMSLLEGQEGFFTPRFPSPLLNYHTNPGTVSFYDTSPLRSTLERFVDFDRINDGETRLSVGSVEVTTGKMVYFDSKKQKIGPEHVMASGAIPPGFPAIEIEGNFYWDGGLSSNTPISYVLKEKRPGPLLCFLAHLFDSYGLNPLSLDDVTKRKKDITFSSQYTHIVELHQQIRNLQNTIHQLAKTAKKNKQTQLAIKNSLEKGWDKPVSLVRFLYQGDGTDLASKDFDFSLKSILEHIGNGYLDGKNGVKRSPWLQPVPLDLGIAVHDMYILRRT